jgi:hypothetical protein
MSSFSTSHEGHMWPRGGGSLRIAIEKITVDYTGSVNPRLLLNLIYFHRRDFNDGCLDEQHQRDGGSVSSAHHNKLLCKFPYLLLQGISMETWNFFVFVFARRRKWSLICFQERIHWIFWNSFSKRPNPWLFYELAFNSILQGDSSLQTASIQGSYGIIYCLLSSILIWTTV